MTFIEQIESCIPDPRDPVLPWERMERLLPSEWFSKMKTTHQNPIYHGEDDVYTHTRMVCGALVGDPSFHVLPQGQKAGILLAALLHDVGKIRTTRWDGEAWVSPHHAMTGSQMVRTFLWQECGLCGTEDSLAFRETVCALVRHHMRPVHLMDRHGAERTARGIASEGELAKGFSWHLLCMLSEADVRGRIADDIGEGIERVGLAELIAAEADCLYGPYKYADSYTGRAYLSGRNVVPDQPLYDDSWGEVIMLSGLPGTGKDTWIRKNAPGRPVVSLDDIRHKMKIRPTDDQGAVVRTAQENAREHLRRKEAFVWNATDLTPETRKKLVDLFEGYGARVRIVYLETDRETRMSRNAQREDSVPEGIVARMAERMIPPSPKEAQTVEWICV